MSGPHPTDRPFTGEYVEHYRKGIYECAQCGAQLFLSETKFESGTGWPSYTSCMIDAVGEEPDGNRTEVHCAKCHSHLGHVFPDGPLPTRQRYCINSSALSFQAPPE